MSISKKEKRDDAFPSKKRKRQGLIDEDEDNDCEALINQHKNVSQCSLMIEGYHPIKQTFYFCVCDPDCQQPLCLACLQKCHEVHLKGKTFKDMISDKRGALCCCGIRNHLLSDIDEKGDFTYDIQCQFLEWSITTKTYIFYENVNQPDEILCMFCYNLCKKKPGTYKRKCDDVLCHRLKCSDKHEDYLSIFEKLASMTREIPFKFEGFTGIQFLNMILMSTDSFQNSFHRLMQTIDTLERELSKKNKQFDFISYINNSPFMKALEKIDNILSICKNMFYNTSIIDISKFIFPLLQRKFNFKAQENIWILKKHLFDIYHKMTFRKDFERLPFLTVSDLLSFNPFQRFLCCGYIDLYPNLCKKYFDVKKEEGYQKNHIDELLRTLDKYRTIRNKGEYAYEILRTVYSEIKKIERMNKFTNEQYMKFFSLNDDIICNSIEDKNTKLKCDLSQMRMLFQMVESILYMSYFYNDSQIKKYLSKDEIGINQITFFHGNSEIAKMIYKNTTHALLYCRTIHQNSINISKSYDENGNAIDKNNMTNEILMNNANIVKKINKVHNKIMFKATEIISLTLNNPDEYFNSLKRVLVNKSEKFWYIFNGVYTPKENEIIEVLTNLCVEMEEVYTSFFHFEIKNDEVEKCIVNKVKQFFALINYSEDPTSLSKSMNNMNVSTVFRDGENILKSSSLGRTKTIKTFMNLPDLKDGTINEKKEESYNMIRLLINKTPFAFTLVKSLTMLLTMNDNTNTTIGQAYASSLFSFLSFYIRNCPDNCLFVLSSKILKSFALLNIEYIPAFIDMFEYIIKKIKENNICLSQNNALVKVIENLFHKISDKSEYMTHFNKLLGILNKLCRVRYFHQEHSMNKLRKAIKNIYNNNKIFSDFKEILINTREDLTLKKRIDNAEMLNNYSLDSLSLLFTKFLKIVNYIFDGNSTLNENAFLGKIFYSNEILSLLKDLTLYLPLRIELIKFYRLAYMDIIIDNSKLLKYVQIFESDIKSNNQPNLGHFNLFQELIKVNQDNEYLENGAVLLEFEVKNFKTIFKENQYLNKKYLLLYFQNCMILPLNVYLNVYVSMIYTLDGYKYIKFYEMIFYLLVVKKYIFEQINSIKTDMDRIMNDSNSKKRIEEKNYYITYQKLLKENIDIIKEDIQKLKTLNGIDIFNYRILYDIFIKHSKIYYEIESSGNLEQIFKKKSGISLEEGIELKKKEYNEIHFDNVVFKNKLINLILKYEKDKTNFLESALSQNLSEKNVIYDATYREIMLRPIFYLVNNASLYTKYRRQNLWHIFRLLQCDTSNTQRDILEIIKQDQIKIKKKLDSLGLNINNFIFQNTIKNKNDTIKENDLISQNSSTNLINGKNLIENESIEKKTINEIDMNDIRLEEVKPVVDLKYLLNIFIENLLSTIFRNCNPSSIFENEDYKIAYMIIKIFKYMCEEHNLNFQNIFFNEIKIYIGQTGINVFDLMMCCLQKILIFAKWEQVDYDCDENNISYFYDIFFCMIEYAIEMIQGTSVQNTERIIDLEGHKNENSYFYQFLIQSRPVLFNNNNDSLIVYDVRISLLNFLQAFIEEKSTQKKIIILIENVYNPMSMFEVAIAILKKLYVKFKGEDIRKASSVVFDDEKCELFIKEYFLDNEFSKNKEFELANSMYHYVKSLANFNNKDAVNIIECTKIFDEKKILNLREINEDKGENNNSDDDETVLIDPRYYEIYFSVKFFEAITKGVWVQGEDPKIPPQYVLFTLDPTVLYLSQSSKNNFTQVVPRDSRSSKLFSLMEYTNYFFIEINQNKIKLSNNKILRFLNKINYDLADYLLFFITLIINLIIFAMAESKDDPSDYERIYKITLPMGIVQTAVSLLFIIIWFISKFWLYFTIEKEKYYISHRIKKEEKLSIPQYMDIIIFRTILSRRETVNFFWNLLFSIIGISSSRFLFIYSLQILIIVNIISTLRSITKAIVMRYKQLLSFVMFLVIEIYIFSTIAFSLLSKDFIHENEGNQENTCGSLFFCFLSHLEFGIRTDGGIGEYISKLSFIDTPGYFMGMFFFQFIFYIITIVIMLAVIGGSVIDTFAELRDKSRKDLNDLNNKCFICHGNRDEIEKGGEVFEEHINKVHNVWDYVDYMIGLKFVDPQETNAINSFVIEQLQDKKISWFPAFGEGNDTQKNEEENN